MFLVLFFLNKAIKFMYVYCEMYCNRHFVYYNHVRMLVFDRKAIAIFRYFVIIILYAGFEISGRPLANCE
jgi:hypothetical protein